MIISCENVLWKSFPDILCNFVSVSSIFFIILNKHTGIIGFFWQVQCFLLPDTCSVSSLGAFLMQDEVVQQSEGSVNVACAQVFNMPLSCPVFFFLILLNSAEIILWCIGDP